MSIPFRTAIIDNEIPQQSQLGVPSFSQTGILVHLMYMKQHLLLHDQQSTLDQIIYCLLGKTSWL